VLTSSTNLFLHQPKIVNLHPGRTIGTVTVICSSSTNHQQKNNENMTKLSAKIDVVLLEVDKNATFLFLKEEFHLEDQHYSV
jgi:hypothetical protein